MVSFNNYGINQNKQIILMVLGTIVIGIVGVYVMILVNEGTTEFDHEISCEKNTSRIFSYI